jgi:DNA-binding Lrp family transcriptional regulator
VDTIREVTPRMNISIEPEIHPSYRPDLVLSDNGTKIMVELKSSTYPQNVIQTLYQIIGYDRLVPDRFDTILLVIPENTLTSPRLRDLIERIQRELPKLQVMTYYVEENKLVFNKITYAPGPLPETLSSDLPSTFTVTKRRRVSLSSPKSMRVVRYLLTNMKTTQTEIANRVNVSIGLVNKIVTYLVEAEIAKYKRRQLVLSEPWKLLNEISWSRSMGRLRISNWFIPDRYPEIEDLEKKIKQVLENMDVRYALTLFSAAKRYTSYVKKYDAVQLYVDAFDETRQMSMRRELRPDEKGQFHVEIFEPDSVDILRESATLGGFRLCSQIQTVIDLYCYGTIGRELAIELYSKIRGSGF